MLLHPTMPLYMVQLFGNLMDNMSQQFNILSWNIRGLNSVAGQENLRQMISVHKPELVCIHETKMEIINSITIRNALGPEFEDKFHFFPAARTSGHILLAARGSYLQLQNPLTTCHTISAPNFDTRNNVLWMITRSMDPKGSWTRKCLLGNSNN
jgi:hypothetical protein